MNKLPHKHIHEKFRHIATMSNEERIKFIDTPRWFGYDKANRVIENMQGLMNMVQQHRMPNLLIIGDSNNGKTTIIKQFVKRFGDSYIDDDLNLVVLLFLFKHRLQQVRRTYMLLSLMPYRCLTIYPTQQPIPLSSCAFFT